ncbi:HesA/MoeB/ThiF family protein [Bowmanella pacifica]|uniref:Molybdopterin-synthase adenylyltransferase MoeB n=1 Tax=Bowmanella pacifica TaxID=502051 RepID=A0A918DLD7_9ALTE|nr:molybdopterin-synthase adenylyltransferase MoeB [Bowmanella pacifica]GGO70504.1 molybdopterin-synthase adenylyltransferase MoeB [Bowmanella pacifica]
MHDSLTHQQALRYNRQILLPGFDLEGQEKLLAGSALIIGVGGLGNAAAQYLAASGVGTLTLCDDDKVELSNLQRQVLFAQSDIGKNKVHAAAARLQACNPETRIVPLDRRATPEELAELVIRHDVVLDCTDNLDSRNLINKLCVTHSTALISGAAIRMEGQLFCYLPGANHPCYHCLSHKFGEQRLSCVESGILSPVVGIIGTMQALEAVKYLAGLKIQAGVLNLFDAKTTQWQQFRLAARPDCPTCGQSAR